MQPVQGELGNLSIYPRQVPLVIHSLGRKSQDAVASNPSCPWLCLLFLLLEMRSSQDMYVHLMCSSRGQTMQPSRPDLPTGAIGPIPLALGYSTAAYSMVSEPTLSSAALLVTVERLDGRCQLYGS